MIKTLKKIFFAIFIVFIFTPHNMALAAENNYLQIPNSGFSSQKAEAGIKSAVSNWASIAKKWAMAEKDRVEAEYKLEMQEMKASFRDLISSIWQKNIILEKIKTLFQTFFSNAPASDGAGK